MLVAAAVLIVGACSGSGPSKHYHPADVTGIYVQPPFLGSLPVQEALPNDPHFAQAIRDLPDPLPHPQGQPASGEHGVVLSFKMRDGRTLTYEQVEQPWFSVVVQVTQTPLKS